MVGRQPHAAMRYRAAEMFHVEKAVNGVTLEIEEDRMRHRRIVPFLGVMVGVHAVRLERAARRGIAGPPGRDRPDIALRAIDRDRRALLSMVMRMLALTGAASGSAKAAASAKARSRQPPGARPTGARRRHILSKDILAPECLRTPSIEVSRRSLVQSRRL